MRQTNTWISRMDELRQRFPSAIDKGLIAAAAVLQNEVKRRLRPGFKSGMFVRGFLLNSVTTSGVRLENGVRVIRVGTNVPYALPWEIGHHNIFTRQFERQERWRPAMTDTAGAQAQAFAKGVKAELSRLGHA